ncbi:DUF4269 domain-containing protein [Metabacillus litoralis]|uniref:DUF4269 domain-containing protein n=1 Tax=Metabacillus litoralis TaxID=152268 RepID=UPI0039B018CA
MIDLFEGMKTGNRKQQDAYSVIMELNIFHELRTYNPVLCGTLPIGIDVEGSDLDIIMEVQELEHFTEQLQTLYNNKDNFTLKRTIIRGREVVKATFFFNNFEFELFGQTQLVHKQNAYLHMIIEHKLLQKVPNLKEKVINLKIQGYKTEEAFCKLLDITGDPYEGLIRLGVEEGIVKDLI